MGLYGWNAESESKCEWFLVACVVNKEIGRYFFSEKEVAFGDEYLREDGHVLNACAIKEIELLVSQMSDCEAVMFISLTKLGKGKRNDFIQHS